MTKKFFRGLSICVAVFAISLLAMYLTYFFSSNYNEKIKSENLVQETTVDAKPINNTEEADHYLARLEGNTIKIYMCRDGGELFLYNLNTYVNDLQRKDAEALKKGVILKDKKELTAFEEDYNS